MGAPRSGTTWLAKIIDSHPDVIYRHEPDETLPAPSPLTVEATRGLLPTWIADCSARTVTKRPFFRKSWQSNPARLLRTCLAFGVSAASHMPRPVRLLAKLPIPDLASRPVPRVALKSVRLAEAAAVVAGALPASRTVLILRHPCGQVASVMRGARQQRFDLRTPGSDLPLDEERAMAFARAHGVSPAVFRALPQAGQYAWSWRAFNEPAYAALAGQDNVYVVVYEALCLSPEVLGRAILQFVGLDWHPQTAAFIADSTRHQGAAGYYAIVRNAIAAAENWRWRMPQTDQAAVLEVVATSPLGRFWPDLA
jgi:hypothetical protein